jgi:hypothetical protein
MHLRFAFIVMNLSLRIRSRSQSILLVVLYAAALESVSLLSLSEVRHQSTKT